MSLDLVIYSNDWEPPSDKVSSLSCYFWAGKDKAKLILVCEFSSRLFAFSHKAIIFFKTLSLFSNDPN